jgi:hypothetical protein
LEGNAVKSGFCFFSAYLDYRRVQIAPQKITGLILKKMKKIRTQQNVKMNLSLDRDFYELLKTRAEKDFVKVATWTKQFLMKNLLEKNNSESKCLTKNENKM